PPRVGSQAHPRPGAACGPEAGRVGLPSLGRTWMAQSPRRRLLTMACGLTAAAVTVLGGVLVASPAGAVTGSIKSVAGAKAVPGSYIVDLQDSPTPRAATQQASSALTQTSGGSVRSTRHMAL